MQQLLKNGECAIFLINKNCSLLWKLNMPCLIVRGCEFLGVLELYEGVKIFPQIFKMGGGIQNKMALWSSGNLALNLGIVN